MSEPLKAAIDAACDAGLALPPTDAPLQQMLDRGIDRGKYDATLPIREKLSEVVRFLQPFRQGSGIAGFAELPRPIVDSIVGKLDAIKRIADEIPVKCQRQTTYVVPPSFHGQEMGAARNVEAIYAQLYLELAPLLSQIASRCGKGSPAEKSAFN